MHHPIFQKKGFSREKIRQSFHLWYSFLRGISTSMWRLWQCPVRYPSGMCSCTPGRLSPWWPVCRMSWCSITRSITAMSIWKRMKNLSIARTCITTAHFQSRSGTTTSMNYPSAMCHSVIRAQKIIFWKMSVWILKLGRKWRLSVGTELERRHSSSCFYGFMSRPGEKSASMELILKNMIMRNTCRFFPWCFRISSCLLFHWTKISQQGSRLIKRA